MYKWKIEIFHYFSMQLFELQRNFFSFTERKEKIVYVETELNLNVLGNTFIHVDGDSRETRKVDTL